MNGKPLIKTHVTQSLKDRFQKAASLNGQGEAEVVRYLIIEFCQKQELLNQSK